MRPDSICSIWDGVFLKIPRPKLKNAEKPLTIKEFRNTLI